MALEEIKKLVADTIKEISDVDITDYDANLFSDKMWIKAVDMIYVVDNIEHKLGQPIASIFKTEDYRIMTVNKISEAIMELM